MNGFDIIAHVRDEVVRAALELGRVVLGEYGEGVDAVDVDLEDGLEGSVVELKLVALGRVGGERLNPGPRGAVGVDLGEQARRALLTLERGLAGGAARVDKHNVHGRVRVLTVDLLCHPVHTGEVIGVLKALARCVEDAGPLPLVSRRITPLQVRQSN